MSGIGSGSFNFALLNGVLTAQAQLRASPDRRLQQINPPVNPLPPGVVVPWEKLPEGQRPSAATKLRQALETKSFVNLNDASFNKAGVENDHKKLFALYKGLQALKDLANEAGKKETLAGQRAGLANRFLAGLAEIKSFVSTKGFDDMTLLFGDKAQSVQTGLAIGRAKYQYQGTSVLQGASDKVPDGITGTETFTVNVVKTTGTVAVAMDLSQISGAKTLDSIIAYMNTQMEAAGVTSRFARQTIDGINKTSPKQFGITVNGTLTETLRFTSAAATPSVYIAGTIESGDKARGHLLKLGNLADPTPKTEAAAKVEPRRGTTDARASAVDGQGNVFVVGAASGDLGQGIVQGDQDVYLRKYDSQGQLIWSRLLGSSDTADAYALSVDSAGNAVVAGRVRDKLTPTATGGGGADSFVTKYDTAGKEVFTRQVGSLFADQVNAVAIGADGSIYIAGQTAGTIGAGTVSAGGVDAYLQKLSATGALQFTRQFGTAGEDRIAALAVNASGELVTASVENGAAKIQKFSSADGTSAAIWSQELGAIGEGSIGGLTVSGAQVFVSGTTDNANLTAGGAASIARAYGGAGDGFVFKLTDGGASASANFVSYIGTDAADSAGQVVTDGTSIYVAGTTRGELPGQSRAGTNTNNAFAAKLDANGALAWSHQYAGVTKTAAARGIAIDPQGSSVLDLLGLPSEIRYDQTRNVTPNSSVRPGDYFTLKVNDFASRKIEIRADDTLRSLALRINTAMGFKGEAKVVYRPAGDGIEIKVKDDATVTLSPGSKGFDALEGLGLTPGAIYGKDVKAPIKADGKPDLKALNVFGMGLDDKVAINTETGARRAHSAINGAMEAVKKAFQRLVDGPPKDEDVKPLGPVDANVSAALARYQSGLFAFGINPNAPLGQG